MGYLMNEILKEAMKQYGGLLFGLITVLLMWQMIFQPLYNQQKLDAEVQRKIVESLNTTLDSHRAMLRDQERLSEGMKQSAVIFERIINQMDEHLNAINPAP